MHRRVFRTLTLPITVAVFLLAATPATGQTIPTTPIPEPADPNQPPISASPDPMPTGRAAGEAGTALAMLRLLPESVPSTAILPGMEDELPKQPALESGFGLSSAHVDSESFLSYEYSIAQAAPVGLSVTGQEPLTGAITQTALADDMVPLTADLSIPDNPLVNVHALEGSARARWSTTEGVCVDAPIADATTSAGSLALLPVIPTMPELTHLAQDEDQRVQALEALPGPLTTLGGLLSGAGEDKPAADGNGALLSMPNTLSTRSTVRLVDIPGTERKAVESTSVLQAADINILQGTPLGLTIKVVSSPTLRVTSTGEEETSSVEYTAPVLAVERDGQKLFELDAAKPTQDVPIRIPLPGLRDLPGFDAVQNVPIIGDVVELATGGLEQLTDAALGFVLDIGVLRLSIAELNQRGTNLTEPFEGYQLGASARMLDVQILPTKDLAEILPKQLADQLPSSLAQLSLGEQVARAYAPHGGVDCGTAPIGTAPPGDDDPGGNGALPNGPSALAQTGAAYSAVPLFWTGTAMLLIGVVLLAGFPGRGRMVSAAIKPSPHPRRE